MVEMTRSVRLDGIIAEVLKIQRQEFNKGNTDNSGASIDVIAVVQKMVTHQRYRGYSKATELNEEVDRGYAEFLKFAKPLSKFTMTGAYHIVRKAIVG